jgi:phage gpG-like protein
MDVERQIRAMRAEHEAYQNADLGAFVERLEELATVPSRVARAVAADLQKLVERGYASGKDPYGATWSPLKKRTLQKHGPPPLTFTGIMREDTRVSPRAGAGIVMVAEFPAAIHMTGAGNPSPEDPQPEWGMEARPMFPDRDELPPSWQDAIDRRIAEAFGR